MASRQQGNVLVRPARVAIHSPFSYLRNCIVFASFLWYSVGVIYNLGYIISENSRNVNNKLRIFSEKFKKELYSMNIVERIKALQVKKDGKASLNKLEQVLGFGKSTISSWATKKPSSDKLEKIADYFGVSVDYLLGRDQGDDVTDEDLKFALFGGEEGISDAQLEEVKKYAAFIKQRDGLE